jgi:hypothetical protein
LALRARYGWGAQKLLHILARRHLGTPLPARSTVNAISRGTASYAKPSAAALAASRRGPRADAAAESSLARRLQGQFKLRNGQTAIR